jgi:hypothetical protein
MGPKWPLGSVCVCGQEAGAAMDALPAVGGGKGVRGEAAGGGVEEDGEAAARPTRRRLSVLS